MPFSNPSTGCACEVQAVIRPNLACCACGQFVPADRQPEFVQHQRAGGRPGFDARPGPAEGSALLTVGPEFTERAERAEGRRPVPTVDVKDGASLAGNESAEASCTGSAARHGARSITSSNHRRAVERSPWPVNAHQTRLPPSPAKNEPLKPRRRKPSSASAPPPTPTSHRVMTSSLVPSQPRRSQTLAPAARWVVRLSSCGASCERSNFVSSMRLSHARFRAGARLHRSDRNPYTARHCHDSGWASKTYLERFPETSFA